MSVGYPELLSRVDALVRLLEEEEITFSRTLDEGRILLDNKLKSLVWSTVREHPNSELARIRFPKFSKLAADLRKYHFVIEDGSILFPGGKNTSTVSSAELEEEWRIS